MLMTSAILALGLSAPKLGLSTPRAPLPRSHDVACRVTPTSARPPLRPPRVRADGSRGEPRTVVDREEFERSEFVRIALLSPATCRSAVLAILCPLACTTLGFTGKDFDPALLSLVIATPSAFSINAAYIRRERAFVALAQMRAAAWSIHHDVRRWGGAEDADATSEAMVVLWDSFRREIRLSADKHSGPADKAEVRGRPAHTRRFGRRLRAPPHRH